MNVNLSRLALAAALLLPASAYISAEGIVNPEAGK